MDSWVRLAATRQHLRWLQGLELGELQVELKYNIYIYSFLIFWFLVFNDFFFYFLDWELRTPSLNEI